MHELRERSEDFTEDKFFMPKVSIVGTVFVALNKFFVYFLRNNGLAIMKDKYFV